MIKCVKLIFRLFTITALLATSFGAAHSKGKKPQEDSNNPNPNETTVQNLTVEKRLNLPGIPDVQYDNGVTMLINLETGRVGVSPSSRAYKNTVKSMENLSKKLMQLRPVSFLYNNNKEKKPEYGLIAEEVAEVFPEIVIFGKDSKPFSIAYNALTSIMLQTLQQQQLQAQEAHQAAAAKEEQQTALIASLTERLELLEQRVAALESKE